MIIGISGKKQSGKDTVGKIIQYLISYTNIVTSQHSGSMSFEFFNSIYKDLEQDWEIKKFADKVKDIVCLLINCTREQLEDEEFKNTELGEEWTRYAYAAGFSDVNGVRMMNSVTCTKERYEIEYRTNWQTAYKTVLTPRMLLQMVGTNAGRDLIHIDMWVNSTMSEYKGITASGGFIDFSNENKFTEIYRQEESNWIITDVRFENELKAIEDKGGFVIRIEKEDGHFSKDIHPSETALDNAEFKYVLQHQKDLNVLVEQVKEILTEEHIL